jgi:hypothetical protein
MSEYARRFAENRIDFTVLRDLTDQDLKDLGIVLGDRRKILRAIAELVRERTGRGTRGAICSTGDFLSLCQFSRSGRFGALRRGSEVGWAV